MGGHLGPVPRVARDHDAGRRPRPPLERVEQRLLAGRDRGQELPGPVGCGDEADAEVLGQAPDQAGDQLVPDPGDVPREVVGSHPVQGGDRHVDGEPVVGRARLEVVADREGEPLALPGLGEVVGPDLLGRVVREHGGVEGEQVGVRTPLLLPPLVEVGAADDLGPDPGVVEVEEGVLVDDDVAPAGAVLELLGLLEQPLVLPQEAVPAGPLAVHERMPDEELAAQLAVDPAERDEPVGDERDAVERDALVGHHRSALARPVRLAVAALDQVGADPLGPLGLDRGVLPGPESAGLHQLTGHDVRRVLPAESAAGEDREPGAPRAEVLPRAARLLPLVGGRAGRGPLTLLEDADVGQQPGQERLVDAVGVVRRAGGPRLVALRLGLGRRTQSRPGRLLAELDLELPAHLPEL